MARTFEELTGEGLDTLYQGALFLTGGHRDDAEHLLVDALTLAYRLSRGAEDPVAVRWLEARLARAFFAGASGPHPRMPAAIGAAAPDPSVLEGIGPEAMFLAAGTLPPRPRAALWLVLVQRWPYADAAEALGVTTERLRELLQYRDALLAALLGAPSRSDSADPPSRTG
jgi:DNA-directed RNA polymerase specialized sigma24 family protein